MQFLYVNDLSIKLFKKEKRTGAVELDSLGLNYASAFSI